MLVYTYEGIKKIYDYSNLLEDTLKAELSKFYSECFNLQMNKGKSDIFEKQESEEKGITEEGKPVTRLSTFQPNRFYRSLENCVIGRNLPEPYKCMPEINLPSEDDYNKYTPTEKNDLRRTIYKKLAICNARLANLANRSKNTNGNAYTKKDLRMKEFLIYASKYNQMSREEEQIYFGISNDNGVPLLDACLPGYTRLSVHFGTQGNLIEILNGQNGVNSKMNRI